MHQDTLPWLVVEAAKNLEINSKVTCGCSQLGLESNVYSKPLPQKNMTRAKPQSISVGWHPVRWYSGFLFVKPEFFPSSNLISSNPQSIEIIHVSTIIYYICHIYIYDVYMYIYVYCMIYVYIIHTYMYIVSYITRVLKHGVFRFNGFSELQPANLMWHLW